MNYVVAYEYPTGGLAIYMYGTEVQQGGTKEQAENFLEYVKAGSPKKSWAVYEVVFRKL